MKRLVLTLFLLAFALGVNAFWGGRSGSLSTNPIIDDYSTQPCLRTVEITLVSGGVSPYDFYVLKSDPSDPSGWAQDRPVIMDQLPTIPFPNSGTYAIAVVNSGNPLDLMDPDLNITPPIIFLSR